MRDCSNQTADNRSFYTLLQYRRLAYAGVAEVRDLKFPNEHDPRSISALNANCGYYAR
jgi:hypothetical protein